MRKWTMSMAVAMMGAAMLAGCNGGQKAGPADQAARATPTVSEPVEILAHAHGNDAALARGTVRLIESADELPALGLGGLPEGLGEVNYDGQDVVIFALGEQPTGGYWVQITGVQLVSGVLYVQATVNRPGDDESVTQAVTYPYAAAVISETGAVRALSDPTEVVGQPMPE